ncbi:MAG: type VI-B CRISPR-associated RNA-guided ribonuclease Cas13b [Planctomycetaceae bacterium]|jgi:hypothetical protein|nr:type VI-B CRISPR-associated RNA-guided ribonuclease Cas13b [Planctomycetaceae bacterium]
MNIATSQNKPFWAMHLNMAANNLFAVVQYLDKRFPKKNFVSGKWRDNDVRSILDSGIVAQLKDAEGNLDTQRKIIRALFRHLPFLRIVQEFHETPPKFNPNAEDKAKEQRRILQIEKEAERALSPEGVAEALCYYAELLYQTRDYFTHAFHKPASFCLLDKNGNEKYPQKVNGFLQNLENVWKWNLRKLRQRFGYDDQTMIHLRKKIGKNDNPKFLCSFFTKGENNDEIRVFTERGLAFFAAQFLETKYVALMFAQLDQREGKHTKKALATLKAYQTSCIRLPKVCLETVEETTSQTLGMDILVELHKCPDELYSLLSQEKRNLFRIDSKENNAPEDELFFKRHGNRFAYLALNYLDRTEKFSSMRFHIDLGAYFFDCYEKGLVDGTKLEERRIGKRLKTFQRIQEAEKEYRENRGKSEAKYWEAILYATPPEEYRQDVPPQYRCKRGNIGLYFSSLHKGFPTLKLNGKQTYNPKPDCFLSLDELPFLTFLAVHGKANDAQNLLLKYRQDWNDLLQKVVNGEKITLPSEQLAVLPAELRRFIKTGTVRIDDVATLLKKRLTFMKTQTERLLKNFQNSCKFDLKPGKSKNNFNVGRIAKLLAADLVHLQRPNMEKPHQGKLTPPNFQALQASLACFNICRDRLPDIFRQSGLVDNPAYPHPFLKELTSKSDLFSLPHFFENYLKKKMEFLEKCIQSGKLDALHLGIRLQNRYKEKTQEDYIKLWAERKLAEPLNLPRGLFAELVKKLVAERFPQKFAELPEPRMCGSDGNNFILPHNSAFMIQKFHEWNEELAKSEQAENEIGTEKNEENKAWQWFYSLPFDAESEPFKKLGKLFCPNNRTPSPFEAVKDALKENYGKIFKQLKIKSKDFKKDEQEKFSKYFNRLGKRLTAYRQAKMQDVVFFTIAKELLGDALGNDVKLSDIKREQYLLEQEKPLDFHYKITDLPPSQDDCAKSRETNLEVILTGKMKIKNYGNFRRLTNDVRIPSLLRLLRFAGKTNRFEYEHLEKELEQYETVRLKIFQKVHELEQGVVGKLPSLKQNNDGTEKEYADFAAVVGALTIPDHKKVALHIVRNAFAHHSFPEFVFERDAAKNKEVQDFFEMMFERQFRSKLTGKPLGAWELMSERVEKLAIALLEEAVKSAKELRE